MTLFVAASLFYMTSIYVHGPNTDIILDLPVVDVTIPDISTLHVIKLLKFSVNFPSFYLHAIHYYPIYVSGASMEIIGILYLMCNVISYRHVENKRMRSSTPISPQMALLGSNNRSFR